MHLLYRNNMYLYVHHFRWKNGDHVLSLLLWLLQIQRRNFGHTMSHTKFQSNGATEIRAMANVARYSNVVLMHEKKAS